MKKLKRLFKVGYKFFESKMEAKAYRDKKGGRVSKGLDHPLFGIKRSSSIHPKRKTIKKDKWEK